MIKSITIRNVATYEEESFDSKKINFLFGNNGTGKTTITRFIENPEEPKFSNCEIKYDENGECNKLIYNQDFVKSNFNNETQLRGIYTFGEESEEKYKQIEKLKLKSEELKNNRFTIASNISKLKKNQEDKKKELSDNLWEKYKKKYCDKMPELFKGNVGSKDSFFGKCMSLKYENEVLPFEKLNDDYNLLYKKEPVEKEFIKNIDVLSFSKTIKKEIFKKEIVENKDIKLSRLIEDLNNSKWVEEGVSYLTNSNNKCPFCQQELMSDFVEKIYKLYDEKYKEDKEELHSAISELNLTIKDIKDTIINNSSNINNSELIANINNYFDLIDKEIIKKQNSLKYVCAFPDDIDLLNKLYEIIEKLNEETKLNNEKIKTITDSRFKLSSDSWNFIRNISNDEITDFINYTNQIDSTLEKLYKDLTDIDKETNETNNEIKELENSITSISKTITQINDTLKKFNYSNFKLIENPDHLTYSIVRENGEDASKNLSEGEFSFISFLYFYNLIFGSRTKSGLDEDHILVIDDPVTSMDSNALFIISTLIRNLIDLCLEDKRHIKQIYLLSHNLYFFKEVTYGYDEKSKRSIKNNILYFIVSKINGVSSIKLYDNINPIKTSYEILWNKLRDKNYKDDSIQNTMRRILEQFLKSIGMGGPNNNNKDLIDKFEDKDKFVVKSLLSYINDGSHSIMDGLYVSQDEMANENAFNIFREIFVKLGFEDHYKMMMNEYEED